MDWATALDASRDRTRNAQAWPETVLAQASAVRMVAAWTLAPAPSDPAQHVTTAHATCRQHLVRALEHDPAVDVPAVMTGELFTRLTDPTPVPLDARAGVRRYTYTPRKMLRRVLDHALDHLNQIDQWIAWRERGVVPAPTDGWVPSTVTLPDDRLPLTKTDLDAWLWRVDQVLRLLVQRAAALTPDELEWQPPDGGWPLRRMLHHVARSERLYAAALDEALPLTDPRAGYAEACRRLDDAIRAALNRGDNASIVYVGLYGVLRTPGEVVHDVLTMEGELLASAG